MLDTKLILVDGCLPGAGKSSTAQMIALQLRKRNLPVRWYSEDEDPHQIEITRAKASGFADRDDFEHKSLRAWRSLSDSVHRAPEVAVMDSVLLQHPLIILLLRCDDAWLAWDLDEEWLAAYYERVQAVLRELSPVLIYLCNGDTDTVLRKVCAERGPEYREKAIDLLTNNPFGTHHGHTGWDGAVAVMNFYKNTNFRLFSRLALPKIGIDPSPGDWARYHQQVMDFLGLPLIPDTAIASESWQQLAGVYRHDDSDLECTIRREAGQLAINNLWEYFLGFGSDFIPLVPTTTNTFFVRGTPLELSFERPTSEQPWYMSVGGNHGKHRGKVLRRLE
jgi:hypothetical protein